MLDKRPIREIFMNLDGDTKMRLCMSVYRKVGVAFSTMRKYGYGLDEPANIIKKKAIARAFRKVCGIETSVETLWPKKEIRNGQ